MCHMWKECIRRTKVGQSLAESTCRAQSNDLISVLAYTTRGLKLNSHIARSHALPTKVNAVCVDRNAIQGQKSAFT